MNKIIILFIAFNLIIVAGIAQSERLSFTCYNKGVQYLKKGNFDTAANYFSAAVYQNAELSKACYNLAYCHYALQNYDSCIKYVDLYMQKNRSAASCYMRGRCNHQLGKNDVAYSDYYTAVVIQPYMSEAYFYMGVIDFYNGDYKRALENFTMSVNLDPNNKIYRYNRACTYKKMQNYEMAVADFNNAVNLGLDDAEIRSNIAFCYAMTGNYTRSTTNATIAETIDSAYNKMYDALGRMYFKSQNMKQAVNCYERGLYYNPDDPVLLNNMSIALFEIGHYEKALTGFNKALKSNEQDCEVLLNRGNVKIMLHDKIGACNDWDKALSLGANIGDDINKRCGR